MIRLKSLVKLARTTSSSSVTSPKTLRISVMPITTAHTPSTLISPESSRKSRRAPLVTQVLSLPSSARLRTMAITTSSQMTFTATTKLRRWLMRRTRTKTSGSASVLSVWLEWASSAVIDVLMSTRRVSGMWSRLLRRRGRQMAWARGSCNLASM